MNLNQPEFLPASREEMNALGWDELDVLLVTGDAYVDSHSFGASLLGRWLVDNGFKTGIVAQPTWEDTRDIVKMGRPKLFAGVTAGALDSLVAHYTAFRKKRGEDAYSPGGKIGLRPNRATIVYTGLVKQAFPGLPVVAGGIEASLRRASHYDFWSDSLRRSIVLDSKADAVLYGMGERSILAMAELFRDNPARIRPGDAIAKARLDGSVYAVHPDAIPDGAVELPSHEAILTDPELLIKATVLFEQQMLQGGPVLAQRTGGRAVVFEVPPQPLTQKEMDRIYALPFTRRAHPSYQEEIPAVAMIQDSVTSHRGCAGGCAFCSLALHQGRTVQSRSEESILTEIKGMTERPEWKGSISDIGGPSSNMWGAMCDGNRKECKRTSCLFPKKCRHFKLDQDEQVRLLRKVGGMDKVNHVRVASGVRHDLALESDAYMKALVGEFTGGQLKIAPEHIAEKVLRAMRKPSKRIWETFIKAFERLSAEAGKEQYIIPYLMSGFPGCTDEEMRELASWLERRGWKPQQVQCFIPTPGTVATAMFFAEKDLDGRPIMVARTDAQRLRQHRVICPDAGPPPKPRTRPRPGGMHRQPERRFTHRSGPPSGERGWKRPEDRGDRGERSDRGGRGDWRGRGERSERRDGEGRGERGDWRGRGERSDRSEREGRGERGKWEGRSDKGGRGERGDRGERGSGRGFGSGPRQGPRSGPGSGPRPGPRSGPGSGPRRPGGPGSRPGGRPPRPPGGGGRPRPPRGRDGE